MKIFLTGSASCLASVLLPVICEDPTITQITGIDIKKTTFKHPKLKTEILDIRDNKLAIKMTDHDAVIHLAFVVKREGRSHEEMRDVNVRGSSLVVDASVKNNIKKFINLSSVSVYGSGENIDEDTPLNPSTTFHYAQHKAELENYININCPAAIQLRSHLIIGENAQLFLREMFKLPVWLKFRKGKTPRQQVVHEKDVVQALMLSLKTDISGQFNLSAPEIIDLAGTYIKKGRNIPGVPFYIVRYLTRVAKFIRPKDEYTWVEILDTTVTVNCSKAQLLLGWKPQFSAWDARNEAITSLTRHHNDSFI